MADDDFVITYETIFEILKQEKERIELQKLDERFYSRVADYLKTKRLSMTATLVSSEEAKKIDKQIDNIKRMLKELYDRREKKLVNFTLDKCRVGISIDKSRMLNEEQKLFDTLLSIFENFRVNIIEAVLSEKQPNNISHSGDKKEATDNEDKEQEIMLIRFLSPVPKFLGEDLTEYGPFEEEDMANLPASLAKVLISKSRAEQIIGA